MEFTGYYDIKGKEVFVGDYLIHISVEGIDGYVDKFEDGEYYFGGGTELEHYSDGIIKVNLERDGNSTPVPISILNKTTVRIVVDTKRFRGEIQPPYVTAVDLTTGDHYTIRNSY